MLEAEIEAHQREFDRNGWCHESGIDEAGKHYSAHRHGWTRLVTAAGSVKLRREDESWIELTDGDICDIESGQLHEAIVGSDGWHWLAAWLPEEDESFNVHE